MNDDLISRQAAIDELEERVYANRCSTAVVSELNRSIGYILHLPSAQRWIPVSERLPMYGEKVLVTFRNKYIDKTTIGVSRCYVQKEGFFSDQPLDYAAVAWMPLPEPYKEEKNDAETH